MDALSILQTKRKNLRPHTDEELKWWISEYAAGRVPEYQMSAWLMAVCWRGMTADETAVLTQCMVESGTRLEWPAALKPNLVDKHSTGGVGDKISLVLAPLVACLGGYVPMMAGRGLGHTGGTIDKLETIPGFQTGLSIEKFQEVVQKVGCSIVSASSDLCLADRKLYALRDVTATVSSIPLQTASIMCKKIAENPNTLVLDVKYGTASFQATVEEATTLAQSMVATGENNGLQPTSCFLTHMDSFIGTSVGNWLEVVECIDLLKGAQGSPDLVALVVIEAAKMLQQTEKYGDKSLDSLISLALETLRAGKAYPKFEEMVQAQGGDVSVCQNPLNYPHTPKFTKLVLASQSGFIAKIDGMLIGDLGIQLGAGRLVADEPVDAVSGMVFAKREGDKVEAGEVIATIHTNLSQEVLDRVATTLQGSIVYSESPVEVPFVVSHCISSKEGIQPFKVPDCLL